MKARSITSLTGSNGALVAALSPVPVSGTYQSILPLNWLNSNDDLYLIIEVGKTDSQSLSCDCWLKSQMAADIAGTLSSITWCVKSTPLRGGQTYSWALFSGTLPTELAAVISKNQRAEMMATSINDAMLTAGTLVLDQSAGKIYFIPQTSQEQPDIVAALTTVHSPAYTAQATFTLASIVGSGQNWE